MLRKKGLIFISILLFCSVVLGISSLFYQNLNKIFLICNIITFSSLFIYGFIYKNKLISLFGIFYLSIFFFYFFNWFFILFSINYIAIGY